MAGNKRDYKGQGGDGNPKKKKYAHGPSRSGYGNNQAMPHGSRGVLITCDSGREDRTADEMRAVIEEHYDKLAGAAKDTKDSGKADGDIAAALAAEVAQLKDRKQRRFKMHHTGVRGCLFLEFPAEPVYPDPEVIVRSICQEAVDKKELRGRHVNRMLPMTQIGFGSLEEIKKLAPKLVEPHFPKDVAEGIEFAVEYEHRSSDKFDRLEVINAVVEAIPTPPHKVNLKAATKTILIQLTRNAVGMSVVEKYKELNKFNLRKCAEVEEFGAQQAAAPSSSTAAEAAATTEQQQAPAGEAPTEAKAEEKASEEKA